MNTEKYQIEKKNDNWIILHSLKWNYSLHYRGHVINPLSGKHFHFSVKEESKPHFDISGRDLKAETKRAGYYPTLSEIVKRPDLNAQYIEVAAGLGEFIPTLARNGRLRNKPTVIDPANYDLIAEMLDYFNNKIAPPEYKNQIDELIERCDLILDSKQVTLFNKTLYETLCWHSNLFNYADVVVDNYGPTFWPEMEPNLDRMNIRSLELSMLKLGGRLYRDREVLTNKKKCNLSL